MPFEERMFTKANEAYGFVQESFVVDRSPHQAVMIQYSGTASQNLIDALVEAGANVTLFLQDEDTARDLEMFYQHKILQAAEGLLRNYVSGKRGKIEFERYKVPASMAGVLIDSSVLTLSWYVYAVTAKLGAPIADQWSIRGHDQPAIVLTSSHPNFTKFVEAFKEHADHLSESSKPARRAKKK
jgi:hypothetical protein